jgi:hypothetical protein
MIQEDYSVVELVVSCLASFLQLPMQHLEILFKVLQSPWLGDEMIDSSVLSMPNSEYNALNCRLQQVSRVSFNRHQHLVLSCAFSDWILRFKQELLVLSEVFK